MGGVSNADVVIYVEHIVREFDVACILRAILKERHGLEMAVLPLRFREYEELSRHNPRVVVVPAFFDMGSGQRRWFYYWPNARIINLAYEQIFQKINASYKRPRTEFGIKELEYSAWGEFYVDYLAGYGVPREHVQVNGNPAYALYREPYRKMFDQGRGRLAEACGLDLTKRWIFLPENYHAAFFDDAKMAEYTALGISQSEIESFREFGRLSLEVFCDWLKDIPEGVEVILRPRPATPLPLFMERVLPLLGGSIPKGLHITNEFSVRDWILASDATGSSYSTTLIESAVAGKPTRMIETVPFPELVMNDWYEKVDHIRTKGEFLAFLTDSEVNRTNHLVEWAEAEMMGGGDPISNIADWIAAKHALQAATPPKEPESEVAKRRRSCRFRMMNRRLRSMIRKKPEGGHPHDFFTPEDVVANTQKWADLLRSR